MQDKWTEDVVKWHSEIDWNKRRSNAGIILNFYDKVLKKSFDVLDVDDNQKILDLACGSGLFSKELLKNYNVSVVGVDLSDAMLKAARKNLEEFDKKRWILKKADARNLPFDSEFDRVLMVDLMCHLNEPERVLHNVYKVLKDGGKAVIITQGKYCIYRFTKYYLMTSKPPTRFYSRKEIESMLRKVGFKKIKFDKIKIIDFPLVPIEEHVAIAEK